MVFAALIQKFLLPRPYIANHGGGFLTFAFSGLEINIISYKYKPEFLFRDILFLRSHQILCSCGAQSAMRKWTNMALFPEFWRKSLSLPPDWFMQHLMAENFSVLQIITNNVRFFPHIEWRLNYTMLIFFLFFKLFINQRYLFSGGLLQEKGASSQTNLSFV